MKRLRQRVERLEDLDRIVQSKLAAEENKKQEMVQYQETLDKLKNDLSFFESKNGEDLIHHVNFNLISFKKTTSECLFLYRKK